MKMKKLVKRLVARVEELEEAVDALQLDLLRLEIRVDLESAAKEEDLEEDEEGEDEYSEQPSSEAAPLSEAGDEEE